MEKRRAKSFMVLVFMVVFGLLVGQSYADFSDCYKKCFLVCMIIPGGSLESCGVKCLKECMGSSTTSLDDKQQNHSFCRLGCASSLCTNLSSKNHPEEKKVESCVNSCSYRCTKNYSP